MPKLLLARVPLDLGRGSGCPVSDLVVGVWQRFLPLHGQ